MFSLTASRAALVLMIALFGQEAKLITPGLFNVVIVYNLAGLFTGSVAGRILWARISR
jgi:hypothetical protein